MALKQSSEQIQISQNLTFPASGTFGAFPVDLQLNPLDNEVFVVTAIKIDYTTRVLPNLAVDGSFAILDRVALTSTRPDDMPTIGDSNCLGTAYRNTNYAIAGGTLMTIAMYEQHSTDNPDAHLDRIGIIATSDFFISLQTDNIGTHQCAVRVYGYRAKADSATYAALVQSEVLSA